MALEVEPTRRAQLTAKQPRRFVDIGASWIGNALNNSMYHMVCDASIETVQSNAFDSKNLRVYFDDVQNDYSRDHGYQHDDLHTSVASSTTHCHSAFVQDIILDLMI